MCIKVLSIVPEIEKKIMYKHKTNVKTVKADSDLYDFHTLKDCHEIVCALLENILTQLVSIVKEFSNSF